MFAKCDLNLYIVVSVCFPSHAQHTGSISPFIATNVFLGRDHVALKYYTNYINLASVYRAFRFIPHMN